MRQLLVTCDEVATKGGNRGFFERRLRKNLWVALGRDARIVPYRLLGRSAFPLPDDLPDEEVLARVNRVPGVAGISIAWPCPKEVDAVFALALERARAAGAEPGMAFKVEAKRSYKDFPLTSQEINRDLGALLVTELGLKVNLDHPVLRVRVLITEKGAFVSTERHRGLGGLPVSTSGKVVSLLSGGLDSPVASWKMFLRGCQVIFCHFLNRTQARLEVQGKIEDLVSTLTRWQQKSVLYVVPFAELQAALIAHVPADLRMIAYRRVMMRIAARVATREGCEGVVTGDSVGQVASQTLSNLQTIWDASELPVLAPLIGISKQEVVELSRRIGTFETSSEPYPDCCQFMIAEHPATRSVVEELRRLEEGIPDLAELEERAFAEAEVQVTHHPEPNGVPYPAPARRGRGGRRGRSRSGRGG